MKGVADTVETSPPRCQQDRDWMVGAIQNDWYIAGIKNAVGLF